MLESTTIDGQSCMVQYLDIDLTPVNKQGHTFQYIKYPNGKFGYRVSSDDPCAWHVYHSLATRPMND